jgi:GH35 family endo-1,4-beta-xylanase
MKFAEMRVRSLLARFGDQVTTWDVVNEALWEPAPENLPQRYWPHLEDLDRIAGYVGEVLDWAREERPENIYVLNDYGMEADKMRPIANDGREVSAGLQRERMLGILERLDKRGRMPNALGLQSHTGGLADPAEQWAVYEQMAQAGIPLHITEFWANRRIFEELVDEAAASATAAKEREKRIEELRAEYIERYMTVAFSHPSLEAFSFWGFMGSAIGWREGAANWSPSTASHTLGPVYTRVRDLINKKWRTEVSARTDGDGRVSFRGFGGEYALDLGDSGYAGRFRLRARAENTITLELPGTVRPPH